MNTNTEFSIYGRQLSLLRFPPQGEKSSLQAWDAADEYLLNTLQDQALLSEQQSIAILNDDFGALACALAEYQPHVYSDSFMAHRAIAENIKRNALASLDVRSSLELGTDSANRHNMEAGVQNKLSYDLVLIKVPRTLALLEQQLIDLRSHIHANTKVIAGAKVKSITNNVLSLFEKYIGDTKTSLAHKKSRLIFAKVNTEFNVSNPFPSEVKDPAINFTLYNHANVFCREQLDIGARLLLEHLPKHFSGTCIDLGCGNGVLGVAMLQKNPNTSLTFVDESYMAIASAKLTAKNALSEETLNKNITFEVSHCLQTLLDNKAEKADLVLCNPPFHQQNVITDEIAWQMFVDAKRMLKARGELRVVANRHLNYTDKLKRLYGGCKVLANNRKFVVLSAIKLN